MQNYRTGHFLIKKEVAKDQAVLSNFVDKNAIFHYYDQKPYQDVTETLRKKTIRENDLQEYATPFSDWLKANNRRITVTESKIRYKKVSRTPVYFRILKTVTGTPGLNRMPFDIILTTNALKPGDKIAPQEGFGYGMVVQSLPKQHGDGWLYSVRSIDPNKNTHFPLAYLRENTRIVKRGSTNVSEGSDQWGSVLWDKGVAVLTWEVGTFKTGKELKITDEALRHAFTAEPMDKDNKPIPDMPKVFMTEAELHMKMEAEKEMEEDLLWSQYNYTIPDTSTRLHRQIGAGAFDFFRDGNIKEYSPVYENSSIRELSDFTDSLWHNIAGQIVYGTGKPGLELASRWIQREFGTETVIRDYDHYIERSGNLFPGGPEAWKYKRPTFNAYELPSGGVISFELWPWLDVRGRHAKVHPKTNKPLLGYHFIGARYVGSGPESNITLVNRAGGELWGYDPGATGIYGLGSGSKSLMTHGGRYAVLRHQNEYGLFVDDVNDWVWFRPNIG